MRAMAPAGACMRGAGPTGDDPGHLSAARRRNAIGYTIVNSPLGRLLVAATERGLCAVYLGDSDAALETILRQEYPAATITPDGGTLGPWVAAILRHLEGQPLPPDLPLDVQATAFQGRVWAALRAIPYGATRSYSAVAAALGEPKSGPRRGRSLRPQPGGAGHPLPSRGAGRWRPRRLPLGRRAQTGAAGAGTKSPRRHGGHRDLCALGRLRFQAWRGRPTCPPSWDCPSSQADTWVHPTYINGARSPRSGSPGRAR